MTSSSPASTSRELRRDARRNREQILAVAREVFAEMGIDASLEEIAQRAGVGIGTLYRRFPTRDALVEAIFEERVAGLVRAVEEAAADENAWRGLESFLERALALQAQDRGLKDVFTRSAPLAGRLAETRERILAPLEQVIERAKAEGALRPDFFLPDVSLLFWASSRIVDAGATVAPALWRRHLGFMLDGMRAVAATPLPEPPLDHEQLDRAMATLREQSLRRRH